MSGTGPTKLCSGNADKEPLTMVFSSYVFLFIFFPIVCAVYFILPFRMKNLWLLFASIVFYGWTSPSFIPVLLVSMAVNYSAGILIHRRTHKKAFLAAGIVLNLALLGFFKYANFFVDNLASFYPAIKDDWRTVALPLGISFFTFQGMSYIIDVYRDDGDALSNPVDLCLYLSLFPQLIAGPIVRFKSIASQLKDRVINADKVGYGFRRFVYGLSKKLILANTFGIAADAMFDLRPELWNAGNTWIGIIAYTIQIYYDFSGYSDMAIGLGSIFGFHFEENFNYPYIARSITEYWKRWHISLGTWFRDYVYIPLGGNRVKPARHIFNILFLWFLIGLWHGAGWTFIVWGLYYGILLIMERYLTGNLLGKLPSAVRWFITHFLIIIGSVVIRSENLPLARLYLVRMFDFSNTSAAYYYFMRSLTNYRYFLIIAIIGCFPVIPRIEKKITAGSPAVRVLYSVLDNLWIALLFILSVFFLISGSYNAFIYFQF